MLVRGTEGSAPARWSEPPPKPKRPRRELRRPIHRAIESRPMPPWRYPSDLSSVACPCGSPGRVPLARIRYFIPFDDMLYANNILCLLSPRRGT